MEYEDEGVCLRADVVDGDGMKFPRSVVEKAVEDFKAGRLQEGFITEDYNKSINQIHGYPTGLELRDDDVVISSRLTEVGKLLRDSGAEYAIGGVIHESHEEGGVRIIDKFELKEVTLTLKRTPLQKKPTIARMPQEVELATKK